jgi:hypothetical protein
MAIRIVQPVKPFASMDENNSLVVRIGGSRQKNRISRARSAAAFVSSDFPTLSTQKPTMLTTQQPTTSTKPSWSSVTSSTTTSTQQTRFHEEEKNVIVIEQAQDLNEGDAPNSPVATDTYIEALVLDPIKEEEEEPHLSVPVSETAQAPICWDAPANWYD